MERQVEQRYPALRAIAGVYKFVAYLSAIAGAGAVVIGMIMATSEPVAGLGLAVGGAVYGFIACLTLLAVSEGIRVFVDIEHNLREQQLFLASRLDPGA